MSARERGGVRRARGAGDGVATWGLNGADRWAGRAVRWANGLKRRVGGACRAARWAECMKRRGKWGWAEEVGREGRGEECGLDWVWIF